MGSLSVQVPGLWCLPDSLTPLTEQSAYHMYVSLLVRMEALCSASDGRSGRLDGEATQFLCGGIGPRGPVLDDRPERARQQPVDRRLASGLTGEPGRDGRRVLLQQGIQDAPALALAQAEAEFAGRAPKIGASDDDAAPNSGENGLQAGGRWSQPQVQRFGGRWAELFGLSQQGCHHEIGPVGVWVSGDLAHSGKPGRKPGEEVLPEKRAAVMPRAVTLSLCKGGVEAEQRRQVIRLRRRGDAGRAPESSDPVGRVAAEHS